MKPDLFLTLVVLAAALASVVLLTARTLDHVFEVNG